MRSGRARLIFRFDAGGARENCRIFRDIGNHQGLWPDPNVITDPYPAPYHGACRNFYVIANDRRVIGSLVV